MLGVFKGRNSIKVVERILAERNDELLRLKHKKDLVEKIWTERPSKGPDETETQREETGRDYYLALREVNALIDPVQEEVDALSHALEALKVAFSLGAVLGLHPGFGVFPQT